MKKETKVDKSLLNLEKKLDNRSTDEIILNKFILKPVMNTSEVTKGKDYLNNINSFVENFKKSTKELLDNPSLLEDKNIESIDKNNKSDKTNKFVKMDLALGVLDVLPKKDTDTNEDKKDDSNNKLLENVLSYKKETGINQEEHPFLNNPADQEILKFILQNSKSKRSRRRIHKIKK